MKPTKTLALDVVGLGMIVYSPHAVKKIKRGSDYLESDYYEPEDVARHVREGSIAGFCTGSGGRYTLRIYIGSPTDADLAPYPWKIALCVVVKDRTVCIRDLYDLMQWDPVCPPEQMLKLDNGYYRIVVASQPHTWGERGLEQDIALYFERHDKLPRIVWEGVPFLGKD